MKTLVLTCVALLLIAAMTAPAQALPICFKWVNFCDGVEIDTANPPGNAEWFQYDCANNSPMDAQVLGNVQSNCGTNGRGIASSRAPNGPGDYYFVIDTPLDGTLDMHQGTYPNGSCWIPDLAYNVLFGKCEGPNHCRPPCRYWGVGPYAGVSESFDGLLYGTTYYGGYDADHGGYENGIVFQLSKDNTQYNVYQAFYGSNGSRPAAAILETFGDRYGTTQLGGSKGKGVVYKIGSPLGFQVLHNFTGVGTDGSNPRSTLIADSNGFLYGTTYYGGAKNAGVVFKLDKNGGSFMTIHQFGLDPNYCRNPITGLIEASDGFLYGTTYFGGTNGTGCIFKLDKNGGSFENIHNFVRATEGSNPRGSLIEGREDGLLYGTTYVGGANNVGVVFKLAKNGGDTLVPIHHFGVADGKWPFAGLIEATDGFLYGTTAEGGTSGFGVVFKLDKSGGSFQHFDFNGTNGRRPGGPVFEGSEGLLYGTTYSGGVNNWGVVFKLDKDGNSFVPIHSFGNDPLRKPGETLKSDRSSIQ